MDSIFVSLRTWIKYSGKKKCLRVLLFFILKEQINLSETSFSKIKPRFVYIVML